MGWSYEVNEKKRVIADLVAGKGWSEHIEVLDSAVRGNEVYFLLRDKEKNVKFIALVLVKSYKGQEVGTKAMDETAGPYYYNCPDRLIKNADAPLNANAAEWRAKVAAMKVAKKASKNFAANLKQGDVVEAGSYKVVFDRFYKTTQFIGRVIEGPNGVGNVYRFKIANIKVAA